MSDIYWTSPVERDPSKWLGERDTACIDEPLHVHVWPDNVGVNVRTHGNTIRFGKWPFQLHIEGARVTPGLFYEWRVRRAINRVAGQVAKVHARHATVESTFLRVRQP